MKNIIIYKYPIGKLRVQPVGIVIFAAVMATLVFIQSLKRLIEKEASDKMTSVQLLWLYSIRLSATFVKLALWLYCRTSVNKIVRDYAKDHYCDVVTNVLGLAAAILALGLQVDIELPEDLPLKEAHAIGETLQIRIEELAEVERAFVHPVNCPEANLGLTCFFGLTYPDDIIIIENLYAFLVKAVI
ncbi:unnamed protein product [Musa textilis]